MTTFAYAFTLLVLFAVFVVLTDMATDSRNRHQAARFFLFALAAATLLAGIHLQPPH